MDHSIIRKGIAAILVAILLIATYLGSDSESPASQNISVITVAAVGRLEDRQQTASSPTPMPIARAESNSDSVRALSVEENSFLSAIPKREQFDLSSSDMLIRCEGANCFAKLPYRQDISMREKEEYMNYLQSDEGVNSIKSHGMNISGLGFGFEPRSRREYVEFYTQQK